MSGHVPEPYQRLTLFAYTVESLAPLYRAVMAEFVEAKGRYRIQLRPEEVGAAVERAGFGGLLAGDDSGQLERALDKLVEWGNLRRSHDTGRVATLEDFRRRHFLYQVTPAGEAAERAVGAVVDALESSGSLQTVMLGAILRNLEVLARELALDAPAPAVLYEALFNVTEQFRALAENASTFMTRLHEAIEAGEVKTDAFLLYKQAVIAYLEEFVGELAAIAPQVTARVREIEAAGGGHGVERLTTLAARADRAPTLDGVRDVSGELARQWRGLAAWFVDAGGTPATVDLLRGAARGAINRILMVLERLHEKRFRRVNRTADLLRLAAWFDAADASVGGATEAGTEIHRMFHASFGLASARHLGGVEQDPERAERLEQVRPGTSWWAAPAVAVAPALRETGSSAVRGRAAQVVDYSRVRRRLADEHRQRRAEREAALSRFAGAGPRLLSELPTLDAGEFALLLALLDRLFSIVPSAGGRRETWSGDGRLRLVLDPPEAGAPAVVRTDAGHLTLPDFALTVEDRTARAPWPVAEGAAR
jgi:uncharacterized protein (TIGR02677 family)